ncbi:TonB-dependent receptor [Microbulbifer sp. SH-1]|uniref:TonB-dependent receptor n=1 Tax=Microbulbifer sp. SH-1 TaxID=2681547 RepID=UPI00140C5C0F|nr:TonB-dependent receptor [Microbulbifer sp. SH-1]QIL91340.1 TonB-dependent receptor [Microbulbifer sp. SH-1]
MFKRHLLSSSIAMVTAISGFSTIAMAQEDAALEEVVVTGVRASLEKGIDIKRESFQIVDSIVAEDIGKFPDNNVVESLQRVTGVQVTDRGAGEVSTVSIRGLNDVTTTVNGRNIFTASGRSVALADIPASLLGQVDVYKTRSADLISSGIAGQIDIHTHRPFNFEGSKTVIAARGIHQEQADATDPNISALASNRWETGIGEIGALVNVSYARTTFRDQGAKAGAAVPFATLAADEPLLRYFSGWQPGTDRGLPFEEGSTFEDGTEYLLGRDAVILNDFTGERERPAANISLQWAPNDSSEYLFEAFYNGYRQESENSMMLTFTDAWWAVDPADPVVLFDGTNIIKERYVNATNGFASGDYTKGKTDSFVYALGGKWDINSRLRLESEVVYQKSEFEDEFMALQTARAPSGVNRMFVDFNSGDGVPEMVFYDDPNTPDIDESDLTNAALWHMSAMFDNASAREGDAVTFTVDGSYDADWGIFNTVEFGLRHDSRSASESSRVASAGCDTFAEENPCTLKVSDFPGILTGTEGFFDGRSGLPGGWAVADADWLSANGDTLRGAYGLSLAAQLSLAKNFDIDETQTAIYAQTEFFTEIGGRELDGEFGLRYLTVSSDLEFTGDTSSSDVSRLLPSLILRYHLTDNLMARVSYGETLRLPNFIDLNPTIVYNPDVTDIGYGTAVGGNSQLEPTESRNLDVSLEYYFGDASALYATWFKRDISGLVVPFRNSVTVDVPNDIPDIGEYTYILSQPDNASDGELSGVELGITYFPENLPALLDGFGVLASYTVLDSEQDIPVVNDEGVVTGIDTLPMFGVSDTSYSVVLAYDKNDLDMRLSYVWREDFLYTNEAPQFANPLGIYHSPESSLDFQLSYDVSDNLVVTFDGTNLTEEMSHEYYEYSDLYNFGNFKFSRTFALGARYSF